MNSRIYRSLLVAGVLVLGCGSSGGGGNGAPFVGMWTYSSGSFTPMNCTVPVLGAIPATPVSLVGDPVTITLGADSSHLEFSAGTTCTLNLVVSGTTATAPSGQTCMLSFSGVPVTVNVTAWTLSLSGATVTTGFSGSAPIGGTSCTASGSGTLTRNATDGSTTDTSAG